MRDHARFLSNVPGDGRLLFHRSVLSTGPVNGSCWTHSSGVRCWWRSSLIHILSFSSVLTYVENAYTDYMATKYGLDDAQQALLHRAVTGENLPPDEIEQIAQDILGGQY